MTPIRMHLARRAAISIAVGVSASLLLGGCTAIGGITGGVAAIASGTATGNPAVGVAVGIGVKAGVDASLKAYSRSLSNDEQTRIATTVGAMEVGETRPWSVEHFVPFSGSNGQVTLIRTYKTPLADCREALFTMGTDKDPAPRYFTNVCQGADGWKWAVAEPAVGRWGALQ